MSNYLAQLVLLLATATVFLDARHFNGTEWSPRIVNGMRIEIDQAPWQVALLYMNEYDCGGAIYSKNIIITAAHCLHNRILKYLRVRAGSTNQSFGGQLVKVADSRSHEKYNIFNRNSKHDIAVLRLDQPLTLGPLVKPIRLTKKEPADGADVYVSGWGDRAYGHESVDYPEELHGVALKVINKRICASAYPGLITADMICAYSQNKGSCPGDSGGPLTSDNQLVGIVSWGGKCGLSPDVYASVAYYHTWLLYAIESLSENDFANFVTDPDIYYTVTIN